MIPPNRATHRADTHTRNRAMNNAITTWAAFRAAQHLPMDWPTPVTRADADVVGRLAPAIAAERDIRCRHIAWDAPTTATTPAIWSPAHGPVLRCIGCFHADDLDARRCAACMAFLPAIHAADRPTAARVHLIPADGYPPDDPTMPTVVAVFDLCGRCATDPPDHGTDDADPLDPLDR